MKIINLCLLVLLLLSCTNQNDWPVSEDLSWEPVHVPVILGQPTTIGRLTMDLEAEETFTGMGLDLDTGTKVEGISLYLEVGDEKELLGTFKSTGEQWLYKGERELAAGLQHLEIAITADKEADIKEKIGLQVAFVDLAGNKFKPIGQENPDTFRLAKSIRTKGDDGVHTYRIPGLATSKEGTLLAVYDVRYDKGSDLQGDIDVGLSRSTDGGQNWEPMKIIMDMGEWGGLPQDQNGIGDPAILVDEGTGTI